MPKIPPFAQRVPQRETFLVPDVQRLHARERQLTSEVLETQHRETEGKGKGKEDKEEKGGQRSTKEDKGRQKRTEEDRRGQKRTKEDRRGKRRTKEYQGGQRTTKEDGRGQKRTKEDKRGQKKTKEYKRGQKMRKGKKAKKRKCALSAGVPTSFQRITTTLHSARLTEERDLPPQVLLRLSTLIHLILLIDTIPKNKFKTMNGHRSTLQRRLVLLTQHRRLAAAGRRGTLH